MGRSPGFVVGRSIGKDGFVTGGRIAGGSIFGRLRPPLPIPPLPMPGGTVGFNGPVGRVVGLFGRLSKPPPAPPPGSGRFGPRPGRGAGLVVGSDGLTIPPPGNEPGRVVGNDGLGRVIGSGRLLVPGRVVGLGRDKLPGSVVGKFGFAAGMLGRDEGMLGRAAGVLGRLVGRLGFEMFPPPPAEGSLGFGVAGRACGEGRLTLGRA